MGASVSSAGEGRSSGRLGQAWRWTGGWSVYTGGMMDGCVLMVAYRPVMERHGLKGEHC